MTAPKSTLRRRRSAGSDAVPEELLRWFAGELDSPPWSALLSPDFELLPARWRQWQELHPDAQAPAGFEWLLKVTP